MIGDLIESLIEGLPLGGSRRPSLRQQAIVRLLFGGLGTALAAAGFFKFALDSGLTSNGALRLSMAALFGFLGCFCLFNVALFRPWRWPGRLFLVSLAGIFITRILFGA